MRSSQDEPTCIMYAKDVEDENNETYPSKKHLATMCNCDERTITRCIDINC